MLVVFHSALSSTIDDLFSLATLVNPQGLRLARPPKGRRRVEMSDWPEESWLRLLTSLSVREGDLPDMRMDVWGPEAAHLATSRGGNLYEAVRDAVEALSRLGAISPGLP